MTINIPFMESLLMLSVSLLNDSNPHPHPHPPLISWIDIAIYEIVVTQLL
jgi:hypothetical protein